MTLTEVTVDRSGDPISVRIGITGVDAPPDADRLAGMLAERLQKAVDDNVVFVLLEAGSAPAR